MIKLKNLKSDLQFKKLLNQINMTRKFLAIRAAKKKGKSVIFLNNLNEKHIANPSGSIDILLLSDEDFKIYLIRNNITHILHKLYDNIENI